MRTTIILSALIASVGFACAGDPGDAIDPADQENDVEVDAKTDSAVLPLGDYENASIAKSGEMISLSLGDGKTYERNVLVYCGGAHGLDCGKGEGTFKLTRNSAGQRYIRFYDDNGQFMVRLGYSYKSSSHTATFRDLDSGHKYTMTLAQPTDCRAAGCAAGTWCSACWGHFACIPNGALC